MSLEAIVVSYNTRELLRACLLSLQASSVHCDRVWVADNDSSDGSADMVAADFPQMQLLRMAENLGFARANNAAFKHVGAAFVLLLNSDAEVASDAIGVMLRALESHPELGAVGPMLMSPDGRAQYEGGRRDPSILGEFSNVSHLDRLFPNGRLGRYLMNDWDHRSSREVELLVGACMLIRTEALRGRLFSDAFFMYGEDVELCQRIRTHGYRLRYVAEAHVLHHGGAASMQALMRTRIAGVRAMYRILRAQRGVFYALWYPPAVLVAWPIGAVVKRFTRPPGYQNVAGDQGARKGGDRA